MSLRTTASHFDPKYKILARPYCHHRNSKTHSNENNKNFRLNQRVESVWESNKGIQKIRTPETLDQKLFAAFNQLVDKDHYHLALRVELVQSFPKEVFQEILKVTALWAGRPGDLKWAKYHCSYNTTTLMGILMTAQVLQVEKRHSLGLFASDNQLENLMHMRRSILKDPLIGPLYTKRIHSEIEKLTPLEQLRIL